MLLTPELAALTKNFLISSLEGNMPLFRFGPVAQNTQSFTHVLEIRACAVPILDADCRCPSILKGFKVNSRANCRC
jgi:hypothetical protein